jgi:hypothetical protein
VIFYGDLFLAVPESTTLTPMSRTGSNVCIILALSHAETAQLATSASDAEQLSRTLGRALDAAS